MLSRSIKRTMNNYDLYKIANDNMTVIECFNLPKTKSTSVMFSDGSTFIGIDPFEIDGFADERVHLAHELGHCVNGAFYNVYSDFDIRGRHEHKATAWAIRYLVPYSELQKLIQSGTCEHWDLAEHFNVTNEFMHKALQYYQTQ